MNEFLIKFIGIVIFMTTPIGEVQDARHVVIPLFDQEVDVVSPGQPIFKVPAHIAYLAYTTDACGGANCATVSNGWPIPPKHFQRGAVKWAYLPIAGFHLTVKNSQNPLTFAEGRSLMPRLRDYCPSLVLPDEFASDTARHERKAATIDVATGLLTQRGDINLDKAVFNEWSVKVPSDLIIEATPYGGGAKQTLTLKPGSNPTAIEVEIGNAPELYILKPDDLHHPTETNHFLVYYTTVLKTAAPGVPYVTSCFKRPGPHNLLELGQEPERLPSADCSNTGYP